jgi:hypothetical protein
MIHKPREYISYSEWNSSGTFLSFGSRGIWWWTWDPIIGLLGETSVLVTVLICVGFVKWACESAFTAVALGYIGTDPVEGHSCSQLFMTLQQGALSGGQEVLGNMEFDPSLGIYGYSNDLG